MKKIIFIFVLVSALFAQERREMWIYDNSQTYADSDTLYSNVFSVYDSLEFGLYTADSIDADVYFEQSVNGQVWEQSSKLLDFISTVATDTVGGADIGVGYFYGRMLFIFAASNNTAEGGDLQGWLKLFKKEGANY